MSFLNIADKVFVVMGVANKRSVAYAAAKTLEDEGAKVVYTVRSEARKKELSAKLLAEKDIFVCDFEDPAAIQSCAKQIEAIHPQIDGILHSVAFANYEKGLREFHETDREDYLQALTISSFSVIEIARAFKSLMREGASFVAISISSQVLAAKYGYMSPIKANLEANMRFLAKSFSENKIRFNTVNAGPLKTSASAGIPGYLENYLYAEKMTLRKEALKTQEVADTAVYLLSPRSSGINAQGVVVNAGMDLNYFDAELVDAVTRL